MTTLPSRKLRCNHAHPHRHQPSHHSSRRAGHIGPARSLYVLRQVYQRQSDCHPYQPWHVQAALPGSGRAWLEQPQATCADAGRPAGTVTEAIMTISTPIGEHFGRWVVLGGAGCRQRQPLWHVLCICGTRAIRLANTIKRGASKSCGCGNRDVMRIWYANHGGPANKLSELERFMRKRDYERRRSKLPERRQALRAAIRRSVVKHRIEHKDDPDYKQKQAAYCKLQWALHIGSIIRQPCVVCNNPKTHGHHEDYSRPLDVVWLCGSCHSMIHHGTLALVKFPTHPPQSPVKGEVA